MVIKTDTGKKVIAESSAVGYREFKRKIKYNVDKAKLKGF